MFSIPKISIKGNNAKYQQHIFQAVFQTLLSEALVLGAKNQLDIGCVLSFDVEDIPHSDIVDVQTELELIKKLILCAGSDIKGVPP